MDRRKTAENVIRELTALKTDIFVLEMKEFNASVAAFKEGDYFEMELYDGKRKAYEEVQKVIDETIGKWLAPVD